MFLAPLLCPLFIKVNVIKTLPQFGNQFDLFQPKHKVIFPTKKKKGNAVSTVQGASKELRSEAVSSGGPLLGSQPAR